MTDEEFNQAVNSHLKSWRWMAKRKLRSWEDAEDAVQTTLMLAYRKRQQFASRAKLSTWISAILFNVIRMEFRRCARRAQDQSVSLDNGTPDDSATFADILVDPKASPERRVIARERLRLTTERLAKLPKPQEKTILLLYAEASASEISKALGIPEGTVKANMSRGRQHLRQLEQIPIYK